MHTQGECGQAAEATCTQRCTREAAGSAGSLAYWWRGVGALRCEVRRVGTLGSMCTGVSPTSACLIQCVPSAARVGQPAVGRHPRATMCWALRGEQAHSPLPRPQREGWHPGSLGNVVSQILRNPTPASYNSLSSPNSSPRAHTEKATWLHLHINEQIPLREF